MNNLKNENKTGYKNSSWGCGKIKELSPLQLSCKLAGKHHTICYYSYTKRCKTLPKRMQEFIANNEPYKEYALLKEYMGNEVKVTISMK